MNDNSKQNLHQDSVYKDKLWLDRLSKTQTDMFERINQTQQGFYNSLYDNNDLFLEKQMYIPKSSNYFSISDYRFEHDFTFQRDRARVIHSASFRRLQSKTQIMAGEDNDFYRTRLTHSIEVAQIGSGIVESIKTKLRDGIRVNDYNIFNTLANFHDSNTVLKLLNSYLVEAICLAHDLGHPPFGHGGENALNYKMFDHGGFEGNAQSFRIITCLGEYSKNCGLDLTRRALLGVIKYPVLYSTIMQKDKSYIELKNSMKHLIKNSGFDVNIFTPPKCIYDSEAEIFNWVLGTISDEDRSRFLELEPQDGKLRTKYRSFDNSIMDLADDIAYGIHDLEDGVTLKYIDKDLFAFEVVSQFSNKINFVSSKRVYNMDDVAKMLFSQDSADNKHAISLLVTYLINGIELQINYEFNEKLLKYNVVLTSLARQFLDTLKKFVFKYVIKSVDFATQEFKGQLMIMRMFDDLYSNAERLLTPKYYSLFEVAESESMKKRVVCDYIANMSNVYAEQVYSKMYLPS